MSGRPRALDEVKRREVCALVSAGCGLEGAARYVGVNAVTIRREAMRNSEFYEQLRSAELGAQLSPLQAMRKAAQTHWRAAAWFLERTQPNQFGCRNPQRFTERQVSDLLAQIFEEAMAQIDDPDTAERVNGKIRQILEANRLECRALETPRPDVHSRRRQLLERRSGDREADTPPPGAEPAEPPEAPRLDESYSSLATDN